MVPGRNGRSKGSASRIIPALAVLFAVTMLLTATAMAATASEKPAQTGDAKCLKCHSKNPKKTLEDGEILSLHVELTELADSVHSGIGCTDCHTAIAGKKHPARKPIGSKREFSLAQSQNCRGCHAEKFDQYEGSIHASLVKAGNTSAPMCKDCHGAHAVQPMDTDGSESGLPCKGCHEDIYAAYTQSVHGKARTEGNVIRPGNVHAPACADCHQAHEVTAVAAGDRLKTVCMGCHEGVLLAHDQWLPNAALHLDVVSCAACHAPLAERGIDLELYHELTTGAPAGQMDRTQAMGKRMSTTDADGDGLDAQELSKLARKSSQTGRAEDMALRGRMKVRSGVEAHQLAIKSSAVRNCDSCHQEGSEAFGNVTVSVSRPDGGTERYPADSDLLGSVVSVSDFYAIGGTRIKLLDGLLILGLIGGLAIPIVHLAAGKLLRKRNDGIERIKAQSSQAIQTAPSEPDKVYINPLPVRIWHWINALGFVLLVLTGVQLRYLDLFQLMTFEMAVKLHNWVGFTVIGNYFVWLGYYLSSDRISNYQPVLDAQSFFRNLFLQMRYYSYGIFKGEHSPHHVQPYDKFNPMQRMTYQLVMMVAVPIQFFTGLMLWNIKGFHGWIEMMGGIRVVDTIHVLLFIFFVSFILVHAYMGALGQKRSTHFKEMLTGYEEPED